MKTLSDHEYETLLAKAAECDRLHALVNTPELVNFPTAVHLEAVHQEERWGRQDRETKAAIDWFWLVGYLSTRALEHDKEAERLHAQSLSMDTATRAFCAEQVAHHREKAVHHTITTAAALNHWHASMLRKMNAPPAETATSLSPQLSAIDVGLEEAVAA